MIKIVGAGMAGLLAANMLRHRDPVIYEKQPTLPNNHSAVLRFRTPVIGDILNIPFKKVTMIKDHLPWKNSIADALAYSFKNTGKYRSDRSIIAGQTIADRWIAPPDFIAQMAKNTIIKFDQLGFKDLDLPIISTVPMPMLMHQLDFPDKNNINFEYMNGINIKASIIDCDAYVSLLVPEPAFKFSRISITGYELTIEFSNLTAVDELEQIAIVGDLLGIPPNYIHEINVIPQKYAKITPIDDDIRKAFMFWATDKFNIYSLGRFATWRPHLLLDDLVQDIRLIDKWQQRSGKYTIARHR